MFSHHSDNTKLPLFGANVPILGRQNIITSRENSVIESFHENLEKNSNGAQISAKFGKLRPGHTAATAQWASGAQKIAF